MKKFQFRTVKLAHSPVLTVPYLNDIIYKIESYLLTHNILHTIVISRRFSNFRNVLLNLIFEHYDCVVLQKCYMVYFIKKNFYSKVVLDFDDGTQTDKMQIPLMEKIMWTIVLGSKVTSKTKINLKRLIPNDFPTFEI